MIEVLMQVRKDKYKDNLILPEGLDLVEEDEQITHQIQKPPTKISSLSSELTGPVPEWRSMWPPIN